jgi:L-amino acid N-acyltransferase YncA
MDAGAGAAIRFKIRRARAHEARALTELSLRAKAVWGYEASFLARCRRAMTLTTREIEHRPHYVAEAPTGAILGFYSLGAAEEEGAATVSLEALFVAPDAIGRGVGRALWDHAVRAARGLGYETLFLVSDPNATGFYLAMGCRPAGGRPSEVDPARALPAFRFALSASVS